MSRKNTFQCPNCLLPLVVELVKPPTNSDLPYDPSDPVQKSGFDDQEWNDANPFPLPSGVRYRTNPHPSGSSEYYRWNRGARHQMKI